MWVQAVGIALIVVSSALRSASRPAPCCSALGTAMVYPTLLAAIGDVAHPRGARRRSASTGSGATSATRSARCSPGITADAFGISAAIWLVAAITFASGLVVAVRMRETIRRMPLRPEPAVDAQPASIVV